MNNTFSSNMLKNYEECSQKYKLIYEEKIKLPQDASYAEEGKNIHALINYYLKGFDVTKLAETLNKQEKALWQNFLNLKISPNDIYRSEYHFNVKIADKYWLTGRIDAIKKENASLSSKYTIFDWKTGKIPKNPESDIQTCVYLYSLFKILKHKQLINNYKDLSFSYLNLKDCKEFSTSLSNEKYLEYEQKITQIISNIKIKAFKKSVDDTKCYKCNYKIIC